VLVLVVFYHALLLPVLGFVNIYAMRFSLVSDHWQYVAMIVPCAALSGTAASLARRFGHRWAVQSVCLTLLALLAVLSWRQSRMYADAEGFYRAALVQNPECWLAHNNLGIVLAGRGYLDAAIVHYRTALEIKPDYREAHNNLGNALARRGEVDAAVAHYQRALEIEPDYVDAHDNLGNALAGCGKLDAALAQYRKALEIKPDFEVAHNNLGFILAGRGEVDEAILHYRKALEIKPDFEVARNNLAVAEAQRGELLGALAQRRELIRARLEDPALLNDTAWWLATDPNRSLRNGPEAVELAERAVELSSGRQPAILDTLAAAYAAAGRFDKATETAIEAHQRAGAAGQLLQAEAIQMRLELYRGCKPYREPASVLHDMKP
jgi:tetratricopeptide (TPR) repeat protein